MGTAANSLIGRKGLKEHILVSFMISSILLNPNLLMLTFSLGAGIALFRLFSAVLAGFLAGTLVRLLFRKKNFFNFDSFNAESKEINKKGFFININKMVLITFPYLLAGIIITALSDRYIPKGAVVSLFGENKGLGVLMAAALGVPVYVCGGGTIPLIGLWLDKGMSPGSAIAFMFTGPATKLNNLSAVKIILGIKNFLFYIAFNILFAVIMGYAADWLLT